MTACNPGGRTQCRKVGRWYGGSDYVKNFMMQVTLNPKTVSNMKLDMTNAGLFFVVPLLKYGC